MTVESGDTIYSLSRRNQVTVEGLMAANGLRGTTIVPGQRLVIP